MGLRKAGRGRQYIGKPENRKREVMPLSVREVQRTFPRGARMRVQREVLARLGIAPSRRNMGIKFRFYRNREGKRFVLGVDLLQLDEKAHSDIQQGRRCGIGNANIWLLTPEFRLGLYVASNLLVLDKGAVGGMGASLSRDLLAAPAGFQEMAVDGGASPKPEWRGHFFTKMFRDAKEIAARRYGAGRIFAEASTAPMLRHYEAMGFSMKRVPSDTWPVLWRGSLPIRPRTGKSGRAQR